MLGKGKYVLVTIGILLGITSCSFQNSEDTSLVNGEDQGISSPQEYTDWSEATHSNDVEPDYDTVFPQESVNRIDIVISESEWDAMQADMEGLYGEFGANAGGGQGGAGVGERGVRPELGGIQDNGEFPEGGFPPEGGVPPEGGFPADGERPERAEGVVGGAEGESESTEKPIYVESQVYMNGTQWYNVGIKYKGHSSLMSSWRSGNYKLPFKLNFDEFEDDYEELDNQRFYGFKKLSFSSNYLDDSLLHEKLASESFQEAGIIAPETAFYSVYVDHGNGPEYFGLYTAVENVDDTLIDSFGDDSGNVYEAEGEGVTLAENTYDMISTHYEKKTNEDEADWSDIQNLSQILNSDLRNTDVDIWKEQLEAVFDVPVFLNWMAVNNVIQNWDTYGVMTHNFYLYNNPETGKLTWIPWDNNESFNDGKRGLVGLTGNTTGEDWPLIRYILDDQEYRAQYVENVADFTENILDTDRFTARVEELHSIITPYVIGENGEQDNATHLRDESAFTSSLQTLLTYIQTRISAAKNLSLENSDWDYDPTAVNVNVRGAGGQRPQ